MEEAITTDDIALDTQSSIRRMGTEIETEEECIDGVRSSASFGRSIPAEHGNAPLGASANVSSTRKEMRSEIPLVHQQFEWYWILILIICSSVSMVMAYIVYASAQVITFFPLTLVRGGFIISIIFGYTGTFVLFSMFYGVMGRSTEQHLRVNRQKRILLKVLAWLCLPSAVLMMVILVWL